MTNSCAEINSHCWKKFLKCRNNRFAHISSQMSYLEAFKKANITPNEIRKCISLSFILLNIVSEYLDLSPKFFVSHVHKDTISLFDTLKINQTPIDYS